MRRPCGQEIERQRMLRCTGIRGAKASKAGAVVDGSFLSDSSAEHRMLLRLRADQVRGGAGGVGRVPLLHAWPLRAASVLCMGLGYLGGGVSLQRFGRLPSSSDFQHCRALSCACDACRWVSFRISIGSGNKTAAVQGMASKGCPLVDIQRV